MATTVTLRNLAAHVKHLNLGAGQVIAVPPTLDHEKGTAVELETDADLERFKRALRVVAPDWAGEVEVIGLPDLEPATPTPPANPSTTDGDPPPPVPPILPNPPPPPVPPASTSSRGGRR